MELSVGELIERPFDLDVGKSLGAVIPIRLDRHGTNSGSDADGHERMARIMIHGNFRHDVSLSRVQSPDCEVQHAGETDPRQVRHHQPASNLRGVEERDRRRYDHQPENHNLRERPAGLMGTEEDPRPSDVQAELHGEQRERSRRGNESLWLPDHPGRDRHHHEERGPNRAEHVVRRVPRRFLDRFVPAFDLRRRCDGSQATSAETDNDIHHEANPASAFRHAVFSFVPDCAKAS